MTLLRRVVFLCTLVCALLTPVPVVMGMDAASIVTAAFTHLIPMASSLSVQTYNLLTQASSNLTLPVLAAGGQAAMKSAGWGDKINRKDDVLSPQALSKDVSSSLRLRYIRTSERLGTLYDRVQNMLDEYVAHGDIIMQKSADSADLVKEANKTVNDVFTLFAYLPVLDQPTQVTADLLDFLEKACTDVEESVGALEAKTDKVLVAIPGTRAHKREKTRRIIIGVIVGAVLLGLLLIAIGILFCVRQTKSKGTQPASLNMSDPDAAYTRA